MPLPILKLPMQAAPTNQPIEANQKTKVIEEVKTSNPPIGQPANIGLVFHFASFNISKGSGSVPQNYLFSIDNGISFYTPSVGVGALVRYQFDHRENPKINSWFLSPSINYNFYSTQDTSIGANRFSLLGRLGFMMGEVNAYIPNTLPPSSNDSFAYGSTLDLMLTFSKQVSNSFGLGVPLVGLGGSIYKVTDGPYAGFNKEVHITLEIGALLLASIKK